MHERIFAYAQWENTLPELQKRYAEAEPFPYIVLENFLVPEAAEQCLREFPRPQTDDWFYYAHINEKKYGNNIRSSFGPTITTVIDELNSQRFVEFISSLTGIEDLLADESLQGGGLHQIERGGFLNIHADFTVHPYRRDWQRRVNILIYLNKNWQDSYNGHLELWDKPMRRCVQKVAPIFNRCVIFNTDSTSYHGHPEPLACPPETSRKSIALYYFTKTPVKAHSTNYQGRPQDGAIKRAAIWADKKVLRAFDITKRALGISDKGATKILKSISNFFFKN